MNRDQKLIFHHLTKTAGTSLISELKKAGLSGFDHARYDFEWSDEIFLRGNYNFFHGHYTYDLIKHIKGLGIATFTYTFLRNPVERVISQFYNWKDVAKTAAEHDRIRERGLSDDIEDSDDTHRQIVQMTLEEFLESEDPKIMDSKFNHQTRYLSSEESRNVSMARALNEACINLFSVYDYFGITELYNRSCRYLEDELNIETGTLDSEFKTNTTDNKNKHGEKYYISKKAYNLIIENNLYDIKLFHFALGVFISRYRLKSLEEISRNIDIGYKVV